jgi:hypothetical protein
LLLMNARNEKDLAVLRKLEELGSDLGKPHTVDFFLYFPSEELATSAASEIERDGYVVNSHIAPQPWWRRLFSMPIWSCCASKSIIPEEETILETSAWFNDIAQRFSGQYDGWGTEVEK